MIRKLLVFAGLFTVGANLCSLVPEARAEVTITVDPVLIFAGDDQ